MGRERNSEQTFIELCLLDSVYKRQEGTERERERKTLKGKDKQVNEK